MPQASVHARTARIYLCDRINEMDEALDRYPAASLIDDYVEALDAGPQARVGMHRLVDHLLSQWADTLTRDLERFPSTELESVQLVRQRMDNARDALVKIRDILRTLDRMVDLALATERALTIDGTSIRLDVHRSGAGHSPRDPH